MRNMTSTGQFLACLTVKFMTFDGAHLTLMCIVQIWSLRYRCHTQPFCIRRKCYWLNNESICNAENLLSFNPFHYPFTWAWNKVKSKKEMSCGRITGCVDICYTQRINGVVS